MSEITYKIICHKGKLIDIDENYQQAKFEAKKILIKQKLDKASKEQIDKIYSILESVINHDPTQIKTEHYDFSNDNIPKFFDYIDFMKV